MRFVIVDIQVEGLTLEGEDMMYPAFEVHDTANQECMCECEDRDHAETICEALNEAYPT